MTTNQRWFEQRKETHSEQRNMMVTWREATKKNYKEVRLTKAETKRILPLVR